MDCWMSLKCLLYLTISFAASTEKIDGVSVAASTEKIDEVSVAASTEKRDTPSEKCNKQFFKTCFKVHAVQTLHDQPLVIKTDGNYSMLMCKSLIELCNCDFQQEPCDNIQFYSYVTYAYFVSMLLKRAVCPGINYAGVKPAVMRFIRNLPESEQMDRKGHWDCVGDITRVCWETWIHMIRAGVKDCQLANEVFRKCVTDYGSCKSPDLVALEKYLAKYYKYAVQISCKGRF